MGINDTFFTVALARTIILVEQIWRADKVLLIWPICSLVLLLSLLGGIVGHIMRIGDPRSILFGHTAHTRFILTLIYHLFMDLRKLAVEQVSLVFSYPLHLFGLIAISWYARTIKKVIISALILLLVVRLFGVGGLQRSVKFGFPPAVLNHLLVALWI